MIVAFTAWLSTIFYKTKKVFPDFNHEFLDKELTTCINGFFILLVFMRHFNQYVRFTGAMDLWYAKMIANVGQLLVTTFLLYSGYGIMESIKNKGKAYVNGIPKKRIWGTLYKYILAVCCFALIANYHISFKKLLLSFIAWESLGNSNWYIFVILLCYIFVFISFSVCSSNKKAFIGVLLLTLLYILFAYYTRKHWWYDTVLCYPAGMFLSLYKEKFVTFFQQRLKAILFLTGGLILLYCARNFMLSHGFLTKNTVWIFYNLTYVITAFLIVFITTIFYIKNDILEWFGANLFSFYILQRIPMICLRKAGVNQNIYLYFILSFFLAVVLAYVFNKFTAKLDRKFLS